ncbi:MAG: YfiR family protein [Terriglobia bacterium]
MAVLAATSTGNLEPGPCRAGRSCPALPKRLCLGFALSIIIAGGTSALAQHVSEYAVKAAFVYDFAKFVTWPPGVFKSAASPVRICVLGDNPFGDALAQITSGKTFNGRAFAVAYLKDVQAARDCQIVFISRSERRRLPAILSNVGKSLTVGDTDDFARQGVMINLFLEADKVRFAINPAAAARAGISISSQLLSLAKIVAN